MNNTITITEGTKTFTITSSTAFQDSTINNVRTIRVPSPKDFDVSGTLRSNGDHFITTFTNANVDINGTVCTGKRVTVRNNPDDFVDICIE